MEQPKIEGFDLRTHIVDPKSGKVLKHQPYRIEASKHEGTFYYRDGIKFHPDGTPAEKPIRPSIVEDMEALKATEAKANVKTK